MYSLLILTAQLSLAFSLLIRRVQFKRRRKEAATQQLVLEMPEDIIQNIGVHGSITGKMMTCIICFDHIAIATTHLPNQ